MLRLLLGFAGGRWSCYSSIANQLLLKFDRYGEMEQSTGNGHHGVTSIYLRSSSRPKTQEHELQLELEQIKSLTARLGREALGRSGSVSIRIRLSLGKYSPKSGRQFTARLIQAPQASVLDARFKPLF